ncbi:bifunctional 3-oxoadipate enol-lactonase/4-carboxymuconolactone decarboxylase PcaDC [Actinacidiphila epipremni]|uniref:3-oxoadipate enol-lactonase n=1 Tax=Actinacidiphila epipremni TaxID=2053013 RepID=A0ABX0ZTP4_9ACTN|nr:3-oxoadipate enol-lactonase [Actinacidiphila epipremni]NJP46365.1 3-oxoadipate enol-lactonase [Actinacidiphila epipremni]
MTTPRRLLHHRIEGPAEAPVVVLGPSLGTSLHVWDGIVPAIARAYRLVRFDLPGHGASAPELVKAGASVDDLAALVLELADHLGIGTFAYAGVSLGGAIGGHLAVHHPQRLSALALICSSARFGEPEAWQARAALVRGEGTKQLADSAHARWFTPGFDGPEAAELTADQRNTDPAAYAACCDALATFDLRDQLPRITAPTLVVAGREDKATPPPHARALADGIRSATLLELPGAAHLAPVEQPDAVAEAVLRLLPPTLSPGMRARRAVLGDAHVDRAIARTTDFTVTFQDFITRYAWGEIWTRQSLDRATRSCITLTALVAGGHHDELAMHVRAALRNGLTAQQIGEVLLQTAVYCGVPAANSAFAIAQQVLDQDDSQGVDT